MEKNKKSTEKNNRSIFLYVGLGLLIFFGVQQYNSTVNAPENRSFTEFKNEILSNNVSEATIKEQSNSPEYAWKCSRYLHLHQVLLQPLQQPPYFSVAVIAEVVLSY